MASKPDLILWGMIASPYLLKMQALADYSSLSWQRWPDEASSLQGLSAYLKLRRGRREQSIERYPARVPGMDEYPAVPYYSLDRRKYYYDSTGLALHLEELHACEEPLVPGEAQLRFICQLVDEAFDEFGLYMVHHNRWVTSAATNVMGKMTAAEMHSVVPPGARGYVARTLPQRQVRRCPYLFSVAPEGYEAGMPPSLTPPSRSGFPPTHEILDTAWRRYLQAMEHLLEGQDYLLGDRFTLADASAYGQLSMNLVDGRAAQLLEEFAPRTYQWLCSIRDGGHTGSRGELYLGEGLVPLIEAIGETFSPLMRQNAVAFERYRAEGKSEFNEAAFDRGDCLYEGELLDRPFRAVAKSFQVVVWREVCEAWSALSVENRRALSARYPTLDDDAFSNPAPA